MNYQRFWELKLTSGLRKKRKNENIQLLKSSLLRPRERPNCGRVVNNVLLRGGFLENRRLGRSSGH